MLSPLLMLTTVITTGKIKFYYRPDIIKFISFSYAPYGYAHRGYYGYPYAHRAYGYYGYHH